MSTFNEAKTFGIIFSSIEVSSGHGSNVLHTLTIALFNILNLKVWFISYLYTDIRDFVQLTHGAIGSKASHIENMNQGVTWVFILRAWKKKTTKSKVLYFNPRVKQRSILIAFKNFQVDFCGIYKYIHKSIFCVKGESEKEWKRQRDWDRKRYGQREEGRVN